MSENEVHICPIMIRTVIWENNKCTEDCNEDDCPILSLKQSKEHFN